MNGIKGMLSAMLVGLLSSGALAGDLTVEESGTAPAKKITATAAGRSRPGSRLGGPDVRARRRHLSEGRRPLDMPSVRSSPSATAA